MMGSGLGGMWWYWLFVPLLVLGLGLLVVVAVRTVGTGSGRAGSVGSGGQPPASGQPRRILDERYARGELTTEEYRERLQGLAEGH